MRDKTTTILLIGMFFLITVKMVKSAVDVADKSLYLMAAFIIAAILNILAGTLYLSVPGAKKTIAWLAVMTGVFGVGALIAKSILFS